MYRLLETPRNGNMENCRRTYSSFHSLIDCDVLKLSYSYSYQPLCRFHLPPAYSSPCEPVAGPAFAAADAAAAGDGSEIDNGDPFVGSADRYGCCTVATDAVVLFDSPKLLHSDVSVVVVSCTRLCLLDSRSWALMLESARHSRCPFGFLKSYRFLFLSYGGDGDGCCCSDRPSPSDAGSTSDVHDGPVPAFGHRPNHRRHLSRAPISRDAYLHEANESV